MLCCAVLWSAVLRCAALCCAVLHCGAMRVLFCAVVGFFIVLARISLNQLSFYLVCPDICNHNLLKGMGSRDLAEVGSERAWLLTHGHEV